MLLACLFYCLGKAADYVVTHALQIAIHWKLPLSLIGLILGLGTSLPEFGVGIQSLVSRVEAFSIGNLLGGIPLLFGLILGLHIFFHRDVSSRKKIQPLFYSFLYFLVPMALALDGAIQWWDGLILIGGYVVLAHALMKNTEMKEPLRIPNRSMHHVWKFGIALALILILSYFIVQISLRLLGYFSWSPLILGAIILAIGTNLPEIVITLQSWRRQKKHLAMAHILGSALANLFFLGFFSLIRPFAILDSDAFILFGWAALFAGLFYWFAKTEHRLRRWEGAFLVSAYLMFVLVSSLI